jgi:hypothetical protein
MTKPRFFFDRCCPSKIANVIRAFEDEFEVRHFAEDSRFAPDEDDVVWMPRLAADKADWVVISMDSKILKKPHERECLRVCDLRFFFSAPLGCRCRCATSAGS